MSSGQCVHTLRGHNDEILDVSFNATGSKLVTASADGTSRVFNTVNGACQAILIGHEGEISKICFNPQGTRILTASSDKTGKRCKLFTAGVYIAVMKSCTSVSSKAHAQSPDLMTIEVYALLSKLSITVSHTHICAYVVQQVDCGRLKLVIVYRY